MSSEMKVQSAGSVGDGSPSEIPTFSIVQGFSGLEHLLREDKNYDYQYFGGGGFRLNSSDYSAEVLEGMVFFCHILPHDTYSGEFTSFSESTNDKQAAATACGQIVACNPKVTTAEFATAVRRTLRDVNLTLYTTRETIPPKVYGQLIATLVFIKALPELPEDVSKSADVLLDHIRNIGLSKSTNAIYYHIRDGLSGFFQKEGSWTKTFNTCGLGWVFGKKV